MLLKSKNNVIGLGERAAVEVVNIDALRVDGAYGPYSTSTAGAFPAGAVFPVSLVVSNTGDTQTLTDNDSTVFTRNYGLDGWGDWV